MRPPHRRLALATALLSLPAVHCAAAAPINTEPEPFEMVYVGKPPDVIYLPTPDEVVDGMLSLAGVNAGDVVYDLGCGDGRIVIAAARRGARAVGYDIDPDRVREARANVRAAGVEQSVEIYEADLFHVDLRGASVVTLYLLEELNLQLRPRLLSQLRPGSRVVSHAFAMGDWAPARTRRFGGKYVYLWIIPEPRKASR
jgi:SAM-dependent methyltransferase